MSGRGVVSALEPGSEALPQSLGPRSPHETDPADTNTFFLQAEPRLPENVYLADPFLRRLLNYYTHSRDSSSSSSSSSSIRNAVLESIETDLIRCGKRVSSEVDVLGCLAEENHPRLQSFTAWGRRVDRIETSDAWKALHCIAAEEGIVATGYERAHGAMSRIHQFIKLYLFSAYSAIYSCPLAMTDGAARLIESLIHDKSSSFNDTPQVRSVLKNAFSRLTSRDPNTFWTSGQWMTERTGGSDVARTQTIARKNEKGEYEIFGFKWFTSATDANMTMALARIVDEEGDFVPGSRGLSLFLIPMRRADGSLNSIQIARLKNKLGTRALPTAELSLNGAKAVLVSQPGRGVPTIAQMVNITRIYNSVCAVSAMRKCVHLATDYAHRRHAFGVSKIIDHPLHARTLCALEVETRGCTAFSFDLVSRMGRVECGVRSSWNEDQTLLRFLTPILKLYTGKKSVEVASETIEAIGGQAFIEDTHIPVLLRDAQVLSIWEGTTNILCLDVVRVLRKNPEYFSTFVGVVRQHIRLPESMYGRDLETAKTVRVRVESALKSLQSFAMLFSKASNQNLEAALRVFTFGIARTYTASLLYSIAVDSSEEKEREDGWITCWRWAAQGLVDPSIDTWMSSSDGYADTIHDSFLLRSKL